MRLPIEIWLESSNAPREAAIAFRESVLTYKAGAYRAALLFSYVGMGLWLRRRILAATAPGGIAAMQWTTIQQDLQDDNKWDATMFECTQRRAPKEVFVVDDHLRDEMKYWKNRRNDCAHFKSSEILAPHVESFWLYVQSTIGRWVPNGSDRDLLDRLLRHFDPNLTPPDTDVGPLASEAFFVVKPGGLQTFFATLKESFTRSLASMKILNKDALIRIHDGILRHGKPELSTESVTWLLGEPELLTGVLRRSPSHVLAIGSDREQVRNIWRTLAFQGGHQDLALVASLFRNGLIPPDEMPEALIHVVASLNNDIPTPDDDAVLHNCGFWDAFTQYAMVQRNIDQFAWGNRNATLIAWRLANAPLDVESTRAVCEVFARAPHPSVVKDALRDMLKENPAKLNELNAAAADAGLPVPSALL